MEIPYSGEHLLIGKAGDFFVILSFVASLLATIAYFYASRHNISESVRIVWKKIARTSFRLHSLAVILMIATLFYMLLNHFYEYHYVWQHSNSAMPLRYIFSCFWEGQEGSFMLWLFWNVVIGNILLRSFNSESPVPESPVMAIFSSVQAFLSSMLLGIYLGNYNIGSNPFNVLLREYPDFASAPIFSQSDYLAQLDGRGLNPLLQNYWMTIHPPTLFLGFALTLTPFCFALAALWKKNFSGWLKPALPWTFAGVAILGIGILMGGAWAYEALSFGGFWAWDPVENASLVPWLTLVGAAHTMLIHQRKNTVQPILFFLSFIPFLLVLYATFLTRSGILGEASVHAFTDLGMSGQLLLYLLFYAVLSLILFFINLKHFPKTKEEDSLWSREFWLLIGALILLISAFQITATTSLPVINKIFGTKLAPPVNPVEHYNMWQIPLATIIAFIIGFAQHLKHKNTGFKTFFKQILLSILFSFVATVAFAYLMGMLHLKNILLLLLLFAALFALFGNMDFFIRILKGKIPKAAASFAHAGFGLILLGALISQSQQKNISTNSTGVDISQLGKEFRNQENILLFLNDTIPMGNYFVSYRGKKQQDINIFYEVEYMHKEDSENFKKEFSLFPRVQTNPRMGNVSEPDTKHFLEKDIYTHVTYAELQESKNEKNDFKEAKTHLVKTGDTVFTSNAIVVTEEFNTKINKAEFGLNDSDLAVGVRLRVTDMNGNKYFAQPVFVLRNNIVFPVYDEVAALGLRFTFDKIYPQENKIEISVYESETAKQKEFIIMKAIIFPGINILWTGCILLLLGTALAVWQRVKNLYL